MLLPHTYIRLYDAQGYECSDRTGQTNVLPAAMNEGVARQLETSLLLTFVLISLLCQSSESTIAIMCIAR